ncbi:MAG: type II secretion system protein GspC [Gammaproteobacteria bacterium]|nr:type II secretion system protein GspC [Gammaproteobacteria bacterium]NNF49031.1 type II secretion system protein GspC [Woeseiaceae bacterium]MBT8094972.1 type II secretion system protein GspC [Gammaproteobacteria bacterium]MBT8104642.1 type II secretion system protein GspC [Gammaproteobacteria bacterium]NNK24656.1 type II secretion system protein GspC [Woeseiaceae bacterium]
MINKANWTDFSSVDGGNLLAAMNRVLPPWISLLLVIAIGWQVARIIWTLVPGPAAGDAVQAPAGLATSSSRDSGRTDVRAIAANHLFGEADPDIEAAVSAPQDQGDDLDDTRLTNLVLKGTIASDVPEFSVAVIADGNEEQRVYAIGDALGSGTKLHAVYAERVVLNENGTLTNLRLPSEFPRGNAAPVRRTTSVTRRTTSRQQDFGFSDAITENLSALTQVIRPTPYIVNGEQAGFRLYPGRNRQQFSALGLRPGDILKDINGQTLTDPSSAMQVFQSLGTVDQVTVTVERNGQPQSIVLKTSQLEMAGEQTR